VHFQIRQFQSILLFLLIKTVIELTFCRTKVNTFVKKNLYELRVGSILLRNGGNLIVAPHLCHLSLPLRLRGCSLASRD